MAVGGHVIDVTKSSFMYGPKGPRHCYAGKAVTRALTLQSTNEQDLNDNVSDFTPEQLDTMRHRLDFFLKKFPKVGVLAADSVKGGQGPGGGQARPGPDRNQ